jgi:hypothetical protein
MHLLEVASLMVYSVFVKYCKFNLVSLYRSGFAVDQNSAIKKCFKQIAGLA